MTPRRLLWGLFGVTVLISVTVVALAFTPVPHTGGDNAGYISLAHGLLTTGAYTDVFDPEGLPHTKYPPVFPGLLAILIAMGGRTWVALKMTAAVPTVAAVGLTYLWAERSLGAIGAFGVAVLLAMSSGIVYYSHWVLSDPLFLALTVAALFALSRVDLPASPHDLAEASPGASSDTSPEPSPAGGHLWLAAGVAFAGLAYFTRSAGLPLVVALFGWLVIRRRWRPVAFTGVALGLPMFLWWLRGRGEGVAQYSTEFWMVNPYDPGQGTIGVLGLVPRILENLGSYVLQHGPAGVVGSSAAGIAPLGILLTLAAVTGWGLAVRRGIGPAELFFPLYAGLILLWPSVWGGDRFALPLYPLVFLYGAGAVAEGLRRLPTLARAPLAACVALALLLPTGGNWLDGVRQSRACGAVAAERGPWACYSAQIQYFVQGATWSGRGLPEGAAVFSRKPRHFYLLSGHPSRAFPFDEDPAVHLALADALGARYVLLDRWDGLAARYVGSAVGRQPGSFCYVGGFGQPQEGGVQLLGILPPEDRSSPTGPEAAGVTQCPGGYVADDSGVAYSSSDRIPLLEGLDS